jgi:hypothetical protein
MNTGRSILTASLFLSWAILLSGRMIAAASMPGRSYDFGLNEIGLAIPTFAWLCFAGAVFLLALAFARAAVTSSRA